MCFFWVCSNSDSGVFHEWPCSLSRFLLYPTLRPSSAPPQSNASIGPCSSLCLYILCRLSVHQSIRAASFPADTFCSPLSTLTLTCGSSPEHIPDSSPLIFSRSLRLRPQGMHRPTCSFVDFSTPQQGSSLVFPIFPKVCFPQLTLPLTPFDPSSSILPLSSNCISWV